MLSLFVLSLAEGLCSVLEPQTEPCLPISTLAPSNMFSYTARGSQSGPMFFSPASICRGDRAYSTFPRDASKAIHQMYRLKYLCKIHICPLVGSFHQGNRRMGNCLWSRLSKMNLPVLHVVQANKYVKSAGPRGYGKRTAVCAFWGQRRFSELMS